jgi:hypothetical protein
MLHGSPIVLFRRLSPHDAAAVLAHLRRLTIDDRRLRFAGPVSDGYLEHYVGQLDWARSMVIGCEIDGILRGVAELKPLPGVSPRSAEAAFSVEAPFQNQGLGTRLYCRVSTLAANRGFRRLYTLCLTGNRRMRRIANGYDAALVEYDGETEGVVSLPWPTPFSLAQEALDAGVATITHFAQQAGEAGPPRVALTSG